MSGKANGHHKHDDGSSQRAFTVEQKAAVIRVRKCQATAFYDILGLEEKKSACSEGDIKKAYRKLSLLTHPDKNGYQGADEAFKMVSRAFQVLSDTDKRSKYDKFGGDPDSRFQGASSSSGASPFSGFASQRAGARGPMFEEEISPEELFRQFFSGGFGGGPFGGSPFGFNSGPGFVFNVGGPGVRVHQFGGNRPQRRPHNHEAQTPETTPGRILRSLLPLILLVVLPLLSSWLSGSTPTYPSVRFDNPLPPHTHHHASSRLNVNYYVDPTAVTDYTPRKWKELDGVAEGKYVNFLSNECEWEVQRRQNAFNDARGFWSRDEVKWQAAKKMEMPSCRKLEGWGYRVTY